MVVQHELYATLYWMRSILRCWNCAARCKTWLSMADKRAICS